MKSYYLIFYLAVFLISGSIYAQDNLITGTVADASGIPLPGVNIVVQGTNTGALTDFDGNYSIRATKGEILVFTFVGFESVRYTVGDVSRIDVTLGEDTSQLDEVVVVAYGTQSKRSIVGSVVSLGEEILERQQLTSVTSAIQGNVPGVAMVTSGGQPGENPTIRIRGVGSINASAAPLIIVDGAPFNGNINSISPDQVESLNVLKDAASTALYGSRGANGVIVITTKKGGFNSEPVISLTAITGFSNPAVRLHDVMGTDQYTRYAWEAARNANIAGGQNATIAGQNAAQGLVGSWGYNPYDVAQPVDANGNIVPGANLLWETDWAAEMLRDPALRNEFSANLSGGSERTRYFLSANYLEQEGSVKESNFNRVTTRLNVESNVKDWITLGFNTSFSKSNQNYPSQSGSSFQSSVQWIYNVSSIYPLYRRNNAGALVTDSFGNPIYDYGATTGQTLNAVRPVFGNENAVGSLYNYKILNGRSNYTGNGYVTLSLTDYLSFTSNLSYEQYMLEEFIYAHNEVGYASNVQGRINQNRDITRTLNFINSLNFDKSFGSHTIGADIIMESMKMEYDRFGAAGEGFLPNVTNLSGRTSPTGAIGYIGEERLVGYMGRLSYNFANRYFLEGSYRRDGSTRFAPETRWGDFYAVGASYVLSDEAFFKDNRFLSYLKLKGSYGELGNKEILDANSDPVYFPYVQAFETGWNQGTNTGVLLGGVTDPLLTWETSAITNFGVDFAFLNNRIEGSVEWFNKKSIDLIYDQPLPNSTGNTSITTNVGSLKNYGWEFMIRTRNIRTPEFTWTTGFNFDLVKNEITELTQESFISGTKRWEVGRSLYDFYIREWAGVDPADGRGMWYIDVLDGNGDPTGERTVTKVFSDADRYYVGESLPDINGGFTTDFTYKNFDLNALFNFSFGAKLYDYSYGALMSGFQDAGYQQSPHLESRWQQPGDITNVPLLLAAQNDHNGTSTRFLFDNDYVRLKAITLGYNLPQNAVERMGFDRLRVYLRGDNLWTWQSHFGVDPEQNLAGTTNSRSSILKTASLGLNLEF